MPSAYDVEGPYKIWLQNVLSVRWPISH